MVITRSWSYGSINSKHDHPPRPGHLSGICLLISKLQQMPHGGASLLVQMPHGGASERVQMTNLRNKKTIIAHKKLFL